MGAKSPGLTFRFPLKAERSSSKILTGGPSWQTWDSTMSQGFKDSSYRSEASGTHSLNLDRK